LDGLFRGLTQVLQMADEIARKVPEDASTAVEAGTSGRTGPKGLRAMYGASVRIGPRVAPPLRHPGTVRRNARRESVIDDAREPLTDVHDEGDYYLVIAELPGAEESTVQWSVHDGRRVVVGAESADRRYHGEVVLAESVDEGRAEGLYVNGVLAVKLCKQPRP